MGITVRYIYSACVVTSTPDVVILHDPWFTDGIYDGSWFQYPKVEKPLDSIGDVDLIYVSHIHPDHYDAKFLKSYFSRYGIKKVIIADHKPNYLAKKMQSDGIEPTILESSITVGKTAIQIVPYVTGSISDIDSAIVIKYISSDKKRHCVVNANDIAFDDFLVKKLKEISGNVDILLCGHTGAGPYPQTYFDPSDPHLAIESSKKKSMFFERYRKLIATMAAKVNVPFAGKYVLGGKLVGLNPFRGVADPVEVLAFDDKAIVLADDGGEIDTSTLKATECRTAKYSDLDLQLRLEAISKNKMDYERLIALDEIHQLPIKRLLVTAAKNAQRKTESDKSYFFCIGLGEKEYAVLDVKKNSNKSIYFTRDSNNLPTPRSEIIIDQRYLFGLLAGIYHWNNAEVGSQYRTRRVPNTYKQAAQRYLDFLAI